MWFADGGDHPEVLQAQQSVAELTGGDAEGGGEPVDVGDPERNGSCVVPADAVQQQGGGGAEDRGEPVEAMVGVGREPVDGGGIVSAGEGEASSRSSMRCCASPRPKR